MSILYKPLVTEKVTQLNGKGIYGFIVEKKSNKIEIKKEVERLYSVKVAQVNTICYAGKRKKRYTRSGISKGQRAGYKKAIVTLKPDQFINFYANI